MEKIDDFSVNEDKNPVFKNHLIPLNVRIKIPITAEFSVSYSDNSGRGGAGLKIENPFSLKIKTYIEPFFFGFTCYAADDVIVGAGAVRFDALRNEWVRDIEKRIAATGTSWSAKDTMEMRRDFAQAIQVYPLNSIDASGYAYTEYDIPLQLTMKLLKLNQKIRVSVYIHFQSILIA